MKMRRTLPFLSLLAVIAFGSSCSGSSTRGIADQRSDFSRFLPMTANPGRDGLREVEPFFRSAKKEQILSAIERACTGEKAGSSVYEPRSKRGYYVNCNPRNRQLLNGYVPANPRERPHSR